jgi:putative ABC transport system permease protein
MFDEMTRIITDVLFDLRYAARTVRDQPSFSLAVALTLALGLGLNATVLGMMDALLLRPFQFQDYQRLIVVFESPRGSADREPVAPATYLNWREDMRSVERLVAWEGWGATLGGTTEAERLQGFRVSPGFFEALSIVPTAGRVFDATEGEAGNDRKVVIGDGLWKRRFGADPQVIGNDILLDSVPHTIVGIAPEGFEFPFGSDVWAPLSLSGERAIDRRNRTLTVLGKLAPGRSIDDAGAELTVISSRLALEYPDTNRDRSVAVRTLSNAFREHTAVPIVAILQVGSLVVLLVACANLAGLLLARATDRQREVAVRTALGATRMRVVRQLVTETVLLALIASVVAVMFARAGLELLRASIPADMARYVEGWNNVRLDLRLVYVIPVFAIVIGLAVGLAPALSASRGNLADALKEGDRGVSGNARRQRTRQTLVVAEIALALTLLVAAALTLNGGVRMIQAPGGFDSRSLLTLNMPLPEGKYRDPVATRELVSNLLARLEGVPGVEGACVANVLPAAGWSPSRRLLVEDAPVDETIAQPMTGYRAVSAGYFETMHIPIINGRAFLNSDREGTQPVAIISASLAARYWAGGSAIGRRVQVGDAPDRWLTIVGVAGDVTMYNWWDGIDYSAIYVPLRQAPSLNALSVALRTRGEPATFAGTARAALAGVDPQLAVDNIRTMEQAVTSTTFGLNFMAYLLAACGAIAVFLAAVGIYSMMAYSVSQRRHEFGVRMALGASAQDVVRLSFGQAARLTALGLGVGVLLSGVLSHLMSWALFGVIELDITAVFVVTAGLAVVSFVAAYVPALRSVRLDPAVLLRNS